MNESTNKLQHSFFLILLVIAMAVMYLIWRPFLGALVLAGSFAIVFQPMYDRLVRKFKGKQGWAAITTVATVLAIVFVPLIIVGSLLFTEVKDLYFSVATNSNAGTITSVVNQVEDQLKNFIPDISLDATAYIKTSLQWMVAHLDSFFSSFFGIILSMFIMVIALFYFLRDGRIFRDRLYVLSPLKREYDQDIFKKLAQAINSVVKGSLVIAIVQGVFATVGFAVSGVPNPILWGVAATIASLIPGVGTSLVTVPAIIYLLVTQPIWYGIGLAIWAMLGIGMIDNFMAPYVLNRGMKIHPFLILISVLGGIILFGPIGFIMGPVMLAFFFALLDIYPIIIADQK